MKTSGLANTHRDILNGPMLSGIVLFALPIALSSILQQLFNSVDVAVVGHFASDAAAATAAVGCNGPIINMIINLFVGISVGANVVIANYIGQGDRKKASSAVHTSMTVALISGIFLLFFGLLISRPILELMNTPEDVLDYAVDYLRIYSLGLPFVMIYNFGSAILRCIGDTKRPLFCLIISGVLNAFLNLFFVIVFHLDVAGVAIATVISNIVSSMLVLLFLIREKSEIHLDIRRLHIDKHDFSRLMKIGLPAGIQSVVFSISNVFIQSVLNRFGTDAVAGSAVTLNYENTTYFTISAFSQATITYTSQNYGAGRYDRCRKAFRISLLMSLLVAGVLSNTFKAGHDIFISVFTSDPSVAEYAYVRMQYLFMFYLLISAYEIPGAALRGRGHSLAPALITVFGTCVFRLFWVYIVPELNPSLGALYMVYPISWLLTGIIVGITYIVLSGREYRKAK